METLERGTIVNKAAIYGAVLGIVAGSYTFLSYALMDMKGGGIISSVLWLAKLVGCIWIMMYGMKSLVKEYDATNKDTLKFGLLCAVFSAIITAAAGYIAIEFVFPGAIDEQINQIYQVYGSILDSNSMTMLDKMTENYSIITFFSQLFWCFVYGAVLSMILSGRIPTPDPFKGFKEKEEENTTDEQ